MAQEGGESGAGRAKWLELSNVVVRIGQRCPNKNAVDNATSGLPRLEFPPRFYPDGADTYNWPRSRVPSDVYVHCPEPVLLVASRITD